LHKKLNYYKIFLRRRMYMLVLLKIAINTFKTKVILVSLLNLLFLLALAVGVITVIAWTSAHCIFYKIRNKKMSKLYGRYARTD
jgi:hypothetical protein